MIKVWRKQILATLPCNDLIPNTESWLTAINWNDILPWRIPRYYQFYEESIKDPILIKKTTDGTYHLHPGNNRYIGASLRPNPTLIDAVFFTDQNDFIENAELINKFKGKIKSFIPTTEYQTNHTGPYNWSREWRWQKAFGHIRITLVYENKHVTLLHRECDLVNEITINVKDNGGLIKTLKQLFRGEIVKKNNFLLGNNK